MEGGKEFYWVFYKYNRPGQVVSLEDWIHETPLKVRGLIDGPSIVTFN